MVGGAMMRGGGRQRRDAPMAEPPDQSVYRLPEPFEHFYEREYHSLVSLGYALLGSWPAAEDLAQEAFLAAHQAWPRVSQYEQPGAWVRRVAANRAVSLRRRQLAEARSLLRLAGRRLLGADADQAQEAEEAADFWRAVRALPRRQAQAVALFYLEGRPTAEIAGVLGCSDATVRAHLRKGRLALARQLGAEPGRGGQP
jgi:RNA polymerase sigma factor (sigma-70 family)